MGADRVTREQLPIKRGKSRAETAGVDATGGTHPAVDTETHLRELRAMTRFAARAALDLSDILTLFLATTELMLEELPADHPRRRHIQRVEVMVRHATILTRELALLSQEMKLAPPGPPADGRLALVGVEDFLRNDTTAQ